MVQLVNVNDPKEVGRDKQRQINQRGGGSNEYRPNNSGKAPISNEATKNILGYYNSVLATYITTFNIRPQMLQRDLAYYREQDNTRAQALAKNANMAGDTSKTQNVTIPIVMPQVESALAYHTGVFLSSYPMFGTVAPPAQADAIAQMDTIIGENSIRGAWAQELMKVIRDGLKYDLGACEVEWQTKKTFNISTPEINKLSEGSVNETDYAGNFIKHINAYNLILDTRVSPDKNHIEGEVAGYTEILSAVAMRQRMDDLEPGCTMNFRDAFNAPSSGGGLNDQTAGFYIPAINPDALLPVANQQPFNWGTFFSNKPQTGSNNTIRFQSAYEWTVLYVRLIPTAFGIACKNPGHAHIFKFILVNRSVVIYCKEQNNAHNMLPILVCKPSNDGLGWQSKSFAQNVEPYQYVASSLVNSAIESQRRKVYDRILYDPNRVAKRDMDVVSSVARIPVKNSQYNKDVGSAVHVMPYRDDGVAEILNFSQQVTAMADIANGQNRVTQGQFQKGNKTRQEFSDTMSNSQARPQMQALAIEYGFFAPLKEIIKSNILQYQPPTTLINSQTQASVDIDPAKLRAAMLSFKLSDGLLPSSKMINSELFGTVFQMSAAMPAIQAEYDIMGMLSYNLKLSGANWLSDFKRTPQQQQQYMQDTMAPAALANGQQKLPNQPQPQGAV